MAALFSLTLSISIAGLLVLLILKRYEMKTGHVMFGGLRPVIGRFFHQVVLLVERGVPTMVSTLLWRIARAVYRRAGRVYAYLVVFFEYVLERTLYNVRQQSQTPRSEGGASHFLQEVAAHKQRLLRRAPSKRVIFDD